MFDELQFVVQLTLNLVEMVQRREQPQIPPTHKVLSQLNSYIRQRPQCSRVSTVTRRVLFPITAVFVKGDPTLPRYGTDCSPL